MLDVVLKIVLIVNSWMRGSTKSMKVEPTRNLIIRSLYVLFRARFRDR